MRCFFLALLTNNTYSQKTKTLYEKNKEALRIQLFNDLDLNPSLINRTENLGLFFDVIMKKMQTERGALLVKKYLENLKSLESLKSKDDLSRSVIADYPINVDEVVMISAPNDGPKQPIVVDDNEYVHSFVSMENPPLYPGGIDKFYKFLDDNIKYPKEAKENHIQGKVFVSFIVEKDGSLTNIKIDRKLGYGTDEEAVKVLKLSKRWNPGTQYGKKVRVKYNIPVKFSLPY